MVDGTYKIKVDVLFGPKEGTVVLHTQDGVLTADIDAPVVGKQHVKGKVEGDTFTAKGSGKVFLLGKIDFDISGEVSGDDLHLDIHSSKGDIKLDGIRV